MAKKADKIQRVRLVDVAQKAGVSRTTAAQVLLKSGGPNARVSEETARRITEIAAEMNYRPNLTAQQLAGGKTRLIGTIIDSGAPLSVVHMLQAIEKISASKGFRLLVGYVHNDFDRIAEYVEDFYMRGVEGAICLSHSYPDFGHRIPPLFKKLPNSVFVGKPLGDEEASYVTPDFKMIGYIGASHLLGLGYRRIAFLRSGSVYQGMIDWESGYRQAFEDAGVEYFPEMVWRGPTMRINRPRLVRECLESVLKLQPDAIFATNDLSALWVMNQLKREGISVPEDIAMLSGFRQDFGWAPIPRITSIDQKEPSVAIKATKILFDMIEGKVDANIPTAVVVKPKLIIAESCGCHLKK